MQNQLKPTCGHSGRPGVASSVVPPDCPLLTIPSATCLCKFETSSLSTCWTVLRNWWSSEERLKDRSIDSEANCFDDEQLSFAFRRRRKLGPKLMSSRIIASDHASSPAS
jgi:hypothetical protein